MSLTVADWLPLVRPHLSAELASGQALEQIGSLARRAPGSCLAALEIPLTADSPTIDFSIRVRSAEEATALAERVPAPHPRDLLHRWADSGSLRRWVPELWLEFDLGPYRKAPPSQSAEEHLPLPVLCARIGPGVPPTWVAEVLLPALHGGPALPRPQRRGVLHALASLPSPARLLFAFSLLSRQAVDRDYRQPPPVRLEVFGLEADRLPGYLDTLGARSGESEVSAVAQVGDLVPLVQRADRNHLSFDLDGRGQLGPRVGVEVSSVGLPGREPGWAEMLRWLSGHGLLGAPVETAAARAETVLGWPGWDSFWTATACWPAAAGAVFLVRSLSHFKVVTRPKREPETKVYLLFGPWHRSRRSV